MIKILVLKNNKCIISEIVEIMAEIGEPDCKLINPYEINQYSEDNLTLNIWPSSFLTDQREILIHSDSILTLVDPTIKILTQYSELIT